MWRLILSVVGGLLGKLLGGLLRKPGPTDTDLADSNARAQERLGSERAANDLVEKASRARGAAVDRIVRASRSAADVDPDPAAPFNRDPDGHYRD